MYSNGNSGARSDRFSINDETFASLPILSPVNKHEQKEIGIFLFTLDNQIKKNDNKLLKIRTIKQSLLQKMFA